MHRRWMPLLFLACALLLDALWIVRIVLLDQSFTSALPNLAGAVVMLVAAVVTGRRPRPGRRASP